MEQANKVRLIKTIIVEYEPKPEFYPEGSTKADMARIDVQSDCAEFGVFSGNIGTITEQVEYEIIENGTVIEKGKIE